MPRQQAIMNIAAYAALSLAGVGSCLLPERLALAPLAGTGYVEVPMIERDQPTPIEDPAMTESVAWSESTRNRSDAAGVSLSSAVAGMSIRFVAGPGHTSSASARPHAVAPRDRQ